MNTSKHTENYVTFENIPKDCREQTAAQQATNEHAKEVAILLLCCN